MKRLIYQVYIGNRSKLYDHCVESVRQYCEKYGITHEVQRYPILRIKPDVFATNRSKESYEKHGGFLPIYEKENAFGYFDEYDQIAIVDADIWIRPGAPNIFDDLTPEYDFGGVIEREMPITQAYKNKLVNYTRMQYSPIKDIDWKWNDAGGEFFNMGLMVLNKSVQKYLRGDTPEQFIRRPEFKDFVDGIGSWKWSTDQTLLNIWVRREKMKLKHMNWRWNGLFKGIQDDKVKEAYFVHFFLKDHLPERGENVMQLMKIIS